MLIFKLSMSTEYVYFFHTKDWQRHFTFNPAISVTSLLTLELIAILQVTLFYMHSIKVQSVKFFNKTHSSYLRNAHWAYLSFYRGYRLPAFALRVLLTSLIFLRTKCTAAMFYVRCVLRTIATLTNHTQANQESKKKNRRLNISSG